MASSAARDRRSRTSRSNMAMRKARAMGRREVIARRAWTRRVSAADAEHDL